MSKMFRKFRGLNDRVIAGALTNHASMLQAVANATERLLRERRLNLVWKVVVTVELLTHHWQELVAVVQAWV